MNCIGVDVRSWIFMSKCKLIGCRSVLRHSCEPATFKGRRGKYRKQSARLGRDPCRAATVSNGIAYLDYNGFYYFRRPFTAVTVLVENWPSHAVTVCLCCRRQRVHEERVSGSPAVPQHGRRIPVFWQLPSWHDQDRQWSLCWWVTFSVALFRSLSLSVALSLSVGLSFCLFQIEDLFSQTEI